MKYYLTKIQTATNMRRYYLIAVQATLLGEFCVVREYGRIGGFMRVLSPIEYPNIDEALRQAQRFVEKRKRRGYHESH